MTIARKKQFILHHTPYYYCSSVCVRNAFLSGIDPHTGKNYFYRRDLIESRILLLSNIFSIDVCTYSILKDKYHLILRVKQSEAESWSNKEVVKRWHSLFSGNNLSRKYEKNTNSLNLHEQYSLFNQVKIWRDRLHDISWYMRCVNERIARLANQEDNRSGRFWERRFNCQALLDEKSLVACMAFIDLASIKKDILIKKSFKNKTIGNSIYSRGVKVSPFDYQEYVELIKWTKEYLQSNNSEVRFLSVPKKLFDLSISVGNWMYLMKNFDRMFKKIVGNVKFLKEVYRDIGYKRTSGAFNCEIYIGLI